MAFDEATRKKLLKFVSESRGLLADEFSRQMQNDYGMDPDTGAVSPIDSLPQLPDAQHQTAKLLRETMAHYQASDSGNDVKEILGRIVREQAFTVLNRLCALRMAEARGILIESISKGYHSKGFQLYARLAGTTLGETGDAYRNYLFSVFDEFAIDLAVLFDRYSPMGRLFPKESVLLELLDQINNPELETLWAEDETIGWIYQYFNSKEERKKMRDESSAPRNSRELAVRNQFFTPRYVVEFLTDNTLGRIWYEMTQGKTALKDQCRYLVRRPNEIFLEMGEKAPEQNDDAADLTQEELLNQPVYIEYRPIKDPREILMLDPACGSMHFGLYAFDLFEKIYEEAWDLQSAGQWQGAGSENFGLLTETYTTKEELLEDIPRLIIENNIHGVDIDPRAVQIAGLSLWLRAQRSWKEQNIKPNSRPQIRKSNIVCAEPMPGEKEFLKEFAESLKPRVLGQLVENIFEKMELAGEAGSLLKIEEEIEEAVEKAREEFNKEVLRRKEEAGYLPGMAPKNQQPSLFDFEDLPNKTQFWQTAEERILEALRNYAEKAEAEDGGRLRLFVEDTAKGFSFIDLCRKRFDVVLMNPPFGATSKTTEKICFGVQSTCKNIFASFVLRGHNLVQKNCGKVGAITDRSFVVKETYKHYRKWLYDRFSPEIFVDLGWDVLDANVEVCCYTIGADHNYNYGNFLNLAEQTIDEQESYLATAVQGMLQGKSQFNFCTTSMFLNLPHFSMSYWIPNVLFPDFANGESLEIFGGRAARGMSSGNVAFSCRLLWEVPRKDLGPFKKWNPANVGGGKVALFRSPFMAFFYEKDWGPMRYFPGFSLKNTQLFWRPAIGWGKRTDILSTQLLQDGMITAEDGQVLVPHEENDIWCLLGFLNSQYAQVAIHCICGGHKGPGYLSKIPFKNNFVTKDLISQKTQLGYSYMAQIAQCDETALEFVSPFVISKSYQTTIKSINEKLDLTNKLLRDIDKCVYEGFGKTKDQISIISNIAPGVLKAEVDWPIDEQDIVIANVSYYVGVCFGVWNIHYASGEKHILKLQSPLDRPPTCPPGMLQNSDCMPAKFGDLTEDYPLCITWSGIIIDDEGHSEDIITHIREAIEFIWKGKSTDIEQETCEILRVNSLREYFRKPANFFANHLKRYSKGRRQAPIYWPLSTPSGSYTLWIYYHRLTDQTLYTCVNNFVGPKLKQVSDDAENLRKKSSRTPQEEKDLEKLSDLAIELKDFHDELLRIAKFWKPNLNDGVLITAAPLWKLFQLKAWQTKLKQTWKDLEKGKYDWAHLAYSIWPERVIRASHKDRSYAIAHDLEDDLWEEIENGKDRQGNPKTKWVPKKLSENELKELIAQKTEGTV